MAKTSKKEVVSTEVDPSVPRPRVKSIIIRNFRAIGEIPVVIELDDIVVLVGPNNVGKSSILRAYEVVMQHGSKEGLLTKDDFPNGDINSPSKPEIEVETVVYEEKTPGEEWLIKDEGGVEMSVREKWTYSAPGVKPKKVGWDVAAGAWHADKGPWGAAGVAQPARPEPHRIEAFANPEEQATEIIKLLTSALKERLELHKLGDSAATERPNNYQKLQLTLIELQKAVATEAQSQIETVQKQISDIVGAVFPGHSVIFDPRIDDEPKVNFFSSTPVLRMGPTGGYQPAVEHQGSGARRTLLWAALRILSEQNRAKQTTAKDRPHLLLMDEPELCLHPNAVREARNVLYDLPKGGTWQVMVTTHSPVFIDLSRDNTSIVRVEKTSGGDVQGTTLFRPKRAQLDTDDKARLKLLNLFDPYVAEFFFGGRVIVVEGDTEYTALSHVIAKGSGKFQDIQLIRARGKATIVSICKILNQFGTPYAVLHDCDRPKVNGRKTGKERANPAWTLNQNIRDVMEPALQDNRARLVASVPNFEMAYFGEEVESEKPYNALEIISKSGEAFGRIEALLSALVDWSSELPKGAVEWKNLQDLEFAIAEQASIAGPTA